MELYAGVDPGKSGAIAIITADAEIVECGPIPMIDDKTYDLDGICRFFSLHVEEPLNPIRGVAVERLTPMPVSLGGGFTNFARGESLAWEWMLRSHGIPVVRPIPRTWQKHAFIGGVDAGDTKTRSLLEAQRRWPGVNLYRTPRSRKLDDGISDALHLAAFARDHFAAGR